MRRLRVFEFILMSQLILVGGAAASSDGHENDGDGSASLSGTTWILSVLAGQDPNPGPQVTLRFEADGTLNGSDGCNRYRGRFSENGSALHIPDNMMSTQMACPEPVMSHARAYASALGQTASFSIDGKRLSLRNSAGEEVALFEADDASLGGTSWQVIAYNNGKQAVVSVLGGTHITANFAEDGRVTGTAGCNQYFAAYQTADASVTIGRPGSTRRFCVEPEGVMDQEARFLEALGSVATYDREGDRLTLRNADGALAATLIRGAPAPSQAEPTSESKVRFDLNRLRADGLQGPPDGLRALHYEYCIPEQADAIQDVTAIDPTLQIQRGSPGRAGCREGKLLCLGHTHQIDHRAVLERLAALPYVVEIHESFFE